MTDISDLVVGVVALNGGQLVTKIRLQKTFYLLEQCGLGSGLDFDYHHYGPFSQELAQAADDAVDLGRLKPHERLGNHKIPYVVYRTQRKSPAKVAALSADVVAEKLKVLGSYSSLEMEVASTVLYVRDAGGGANAIEQTKALKPLKATETRIRRALALIRDLGMGHIAAEYS